MHGQNLKNKLEHARYFIFSLQVLNKINIWKLNKYRKKKCVGSKPRHPRAGTRVGGQDKVRPNLVGRPNQSGFGRTMLVRPNYTWLVWPRVSLGLLVRRIAPSFSCTFHNHLQTILNRAFPDWLKAPVRAIQTYKIYSNQTKNKCFTAPFTKIKQTKGNIN